MSIRVFAPSAASLAAGVVLELDDEESRYLFDVRRVRAGQVVELLDGEQVWSARVVGRAKRATLELDAAIARPTPPERIVLLGLPDPTATLEALTLASEAGASEVVLVACERSSAREPGSARVARARPRSSARSPASAPPCANARRSPRRPTHAPRDSRRAKRRIHARRRDRLGGGSHESLAFLGRVWRSFFP